MDSVVDNQPLVTVYITTHNRCELLRRAIDSVLEQTYKNIEIIVVNDGSTDGTEKLLKDYAQNYAAFRFFSHPESKGAPAARNKAISEAKGQFVTGLDDDDEFTEDRVQYFIDNYHDAWSFLCTGLIKFDGQKHDYIHPVTDQIDWSLIKTGNFVGNQIFVLKERLQAVSGFDEALAAWQDYDLWYRLIKTFGPAKKLPRQTYVHNVQSEIARISSSSKATTGYLQFVEKHRLDLSEDELALQKINHYSNHRIRPSISEIPSLISRLTIGRLAKLIVKTYLPGFYGQYMKFFSGAKENK